MSKTAWTSTCMAALAAIAMSCSPAHAVVRGKPVHALALYGEPALGPNVGFGYINPNAPKGGTLRLETGPTFDSLNPFSTKGVPATGLGGALFVDPLMVSNEDEPFTYYCLLCETVELADDNTWIEYTLRTEARFHDGAPVTPEDVVASFNVLREKGAPVFKIYWADVDRVEKTGPQKVRFSFKTGNNVELPLILGQLPILNKAFWEAHDLSESTLDVPVSSGPYRVSSFEPSRFIVYKRDPNYWGKDLAITRGTNNFDEIRFEYYRDEDVAFEAFKSAAFDFHVENTARRWATGYDFPAATDGRVKKLLVPVGVPMRAQHIIYNLRRAKFQDRRVRQALNYAFDFDSMNKTLFYQQYARLRSYWQSTELEAKGLPSAEELALLEPLRGKIPDEVFKQEFTQPTTAGDGDARDNLLKARDLLAEAGWEVVGGQLINKTTKEPFTFEVLDTTSSFERVLIPWFQNLEKLGITGTLRVVDASQLVNRINDFDFDVFRYYVANSLSPGNEQDEMWGTAAADRGGSRNISGVKDPAVDALVATLVKAQDRASLVTATHALDRVLTWNFYALLNYGAPADRFVHWTKLQHPDRFPAQGMPDIAADTIVATTWWANPAMAGENSTAASSSDAAPAAETSGGNSWLIALAVIGFAVVGFLVMRRRSN